MNFPNSPKLLRNLTFLFEVDEVVSADICRYFIEKAESEGFHATLSKGKCSCLTLHNFPLGSTKSIVSKVLAFILFEKLKTFSAFSTVQAGWSELFLFSNEFVSSEGKNWKISGVNEQFRFTKYQQGEGVATHVDGGYRQ